MDLKIVLLLLLLLY